MLGRDASTFERMFAEFAAAVKPNDFIDWAWVKDIAELTWEIERARRAQKVKLQGAKRTTIAHFLRSVRGPMNPAEALDSDPVLEQTQLIMEGDPVETRTYERLLTRHGYSSTFAEDAAFNETLVDMERLQRFVDNAAYRRDNVLRELDRRRATAERRARDTIRTIETTVDAEFE